MARGPISVCCTRPRVPSSESSTLADATPRMLKAICEALNWEYGALWRVDASASVLRVVGVWHAASLPFDEFAGGKSTANVRARRRSAGTRLGEPGAGVDSRRRTGHKFSTRPFANHVGLHAALGFPIVGRAETIGVMEFFSREIREPDEYLLSMLTAVGSQIGLFVEQKRARGGARPILHALASTCSASRISMDIFFASIPPGNGRWGSRARSSSPSRGSSSCIQTTGKPRSTRERRS